MLIDCNNPDNCLAVIQLCLSINDCEPWFGWRNVNSIHIFIVDELEMSLFVRDMLHVGFACNLAHYTNIKLLLGLVNLKWNGMNGVLDHGYALIRLYWVGDNLD